MNRVNTYLVLAIGVVAIGCGGRDTGAGARTDTTAGMETPPAETRTQMELERERQQRAMGEPGQMAGATVTDEEISAFVDAYMQLNELQQQGVARVEGGEDPQTVEAELQPQVSRIFEGSRLTPERYNAIADQIAQDDALRRRVEAQLEARGAQPPA